MGEIENPSHCSVPEQRLDGCIEKYYTIIQGLISYCY